MKLLLDSDIISALGTLEGENYHAAIKFIASFPEDTELCVSMLTIYEMQYGIAAMQDDAKKAKVMQALATVKNSLTILNLGFDDAEIYGEIKYKFKEKTGINQKALKRHNIDIALASIAIANHCVLVGRDRIYAEHLHGIDSRLEHRDWKSDLH